MAEAMSALSEKLADAVQRAAAGLVQVHGARGRPATGSACRDDLVLVADHALERDEDLMVRTRDGRRLPAQPAGRDPSTDLALLRVPGLGGTAPLAATEQPRVGHLVVAVGRTRGGDAAGLGIISALVGPLRAGPAGSIPHLIATDLAVYPGLSGGLLVNAAGEALGIATSGLLRGLAAAIPLADALAVADSLARHGRIRRGYLGIGTQPVRLPEVQRAGREQQSGLIVIGVAAGSPADRSGLLVGDVLVEADGRILAEPEDLRGLLTADRIGRPVPITVIRGASPALLEVVPGERGR